MSQIPVSAKQILKENGTGGFTLCSDTLESILGTEHADKPVIVISVTGTTDPGKTMIFDMMLRHLDPSTRSTDDRGGSTRGNEDRPSRNSGIELWPHLFPVTLPTGEEAVIALMDTQGAADDAPRSQAVQALATLLSSLQIFNVVDDLSDDVLEQLRQSIEFGQTLSKSTNAPAFQKLMFVVHDWKAIDKFPVGAGGGDQLVKKWLLQNGTTNKQIEMARQHIGDCFNDVNGFLLPFLGPPSDHSPSAPDGSGLLGVLPLAVVFPPALLFVPEILRHRSALLQGTRSRQLINEFSARLIELIQETLAPENLAIKVVAGERLTTGDLCRLITKYVELFSSKEPPKPEDVVYATIACLYPAVQAAKEQYVEAMASVFREDQPALNDDELMRQHKEATAKAEATFHAQKKTGNDSLVQNGLKILLKDIEKCFDDIDRENTGKRKKEEQAAEKKKKEESQQYIIELVKTCTEMYINAMKAVADVDGFVTRDNLRRAHATAKEKAMNKFDARSKNHTVEWDSRYWLTCVIGARFRLMQYHNEVMKDAEDRRAVRGNMKAVEVALKSYRTVLSSTISGEGINDDSLLRQHDRTVAAAVDTFKSLHEGDEDTAEKYVQELKTLIGEEFKMIRCSLKS
ncbi:atlastin-like [Amphibalanus amphitrite]|uniref:atlastin-like n=1 Tax=Amphibalanus amphitrite TaxID=1232801 RepID=UPI001C90CD26|nr:atlastin-like [Amphibalanus amphitrite]